MPLRAHVLAVAVLALALLTAPATATAAAYLPPDGKVWHGATAGRDVEDFALRTGRRPAVWQHFVQWGRVPRYPFDRARESGTRVMLHISTAMAQDAPGRILAW